MRLRPLTESLSVCKGMLTAAGWLVPSKVREEWLAEWNAELWHVWQQATGVAPSCTRAQAMTFCLGAFKDAYWLRREEAALPRLLLKAGTASRCILSLVLLATLAMLLAYCRPGVWTVIKPDNYQAANDLVMIARGGFDRTTAPTIQLAEFEAWKVKARHLFTGLAFYAIASRTLTFDHQGAMQVKLARASDNLFDLLSVEPYAQLPEEPGSRLRRVLLKRSFWVDSLHADRSVLGRVVQTDGQRAIIAGIIPDEHWRLPGRVDAWLLEDAQGLRALPADSQGYVLGHVAPAVFGAESGGRRQMYVGRKEEDGYDWFVCESLAKRMQQPLFTFLFALALAAFALPATTSLPLGEYPAESSQVPWATRIRRWAFLTLKFALLVPLVYFAAIDVAYGSGSLSAETSELIELSCSFWSLLFGFRWALCDQRKRCPVCLRKLTNPARVGQFSRNFLAWHGTELVCLSGHGLLHVPDMATSWFSSQRWLYLDSSWSGLFPLGT